MPNRLIRDGFLDSEAVHALSDAAECFFHRLLLAADDAGRIDGRVDMLRARLFPLDSSRRASDVEKALSECQQQALVYPYEWDGRRFLQLTKWQRCSPCVTSKYPWRDGSYKIGYVKRDTRDGEKEFVFSSIWKEQPITMPSATHSNGIGPLIPPMSGDEDVVEGGNEDDKEGASSPNGDQPVAQTGVPFEAIVAEYNRLMTRLAKVRIVTADRRTLIRNAWQASPERRSLAFWEAYFEECAEDSFLNGEGPYKPPHDNWRPDFDYLMRPKTVTKVYEKALDRAERTP